MAEVSRREQAMREIEASHGRAALREDAAKRILQIYGIPVPRSVVVHSQSEVPGAIEGLIAPLAVKIMSRQLLHKSDAGAVKLNIRDADGVERAMEEIAAIARSTGATLDGYLIEEMAPGGQELIIGGFRDEQVGPVVLVGLGGVFVEAVRDTSMRICPISRYDALSMLGELKASNIFSGYRGQEGVSTDAVVDTLLKLGGPDGLFPDLADVITEIDINPVIASMTSAVAVDARFVLSDRTRADPSRSRSARAGSDFSPLFTPRTVGIVGMSTRRQAPGNRFLASLRESGFGGNIYAIHPTSPDVDGIPAFRTIEDVPEPIDYCYIGIPSAEVPAVVEGAKGRVRFAQVISSGFGESREGKPLEERLAAAARSADVRVIGPNCLGTYSPRGGLSFVRGTPMTPGSVGVVSQSGGLAVDTIRLGSNLGLRFSGVVSVGNCMDVDVPELLEFYFDDAATETIGIYIETLRDGRRLFEVLDKHGSEKPVVLLKGGTGEDGKRAAASHTGALAGDYRVWQAVARQTGCTLVQNLQEFVNTLLAFQCLRPRQGRPTQEVVMFGNGGGASVLGTDALSRAGLRVSPLPAPSVDRLQQLNLPPGVSLRNPVDLPVGALSKDKGRVAREVLEIVEKSGAADAVLMHFNMGAIETGADSPDEVLENLVDIASDMLAGGGAPGHRLLALLSDGSVKTGATRHRYRAMAVAQGVPVFDRFDDAVHALANVALRERFLSEVR